MMHAREYAEAIVETLHEPLLVLDERLSVITANQAFFEIFRVSPRDTVGRSIYELGNEQWNVPQVYQMFDSLWRDGNASTCAVDRDPASTHTEAKKYELHAQPLRRSRAPNLILLTIVGNRNRRKGVRSEHSLCAPDQEEAMMRSANAGESADVSSFLTRVLGLPKAELGGKRFREAEPFGYLQGSHMVPEQPQKEKVLRFPAISIKEKGKQRELQLEVVANVSQDGTNQVARFSVCEIVEREEFRQRFLQRTRLESIGILAGGIAHDFNNLLVGILGNAGLALRDAPVGSPHQDALQQVMNAGQRAAGLIRQMLSYAGKSALDMRPVDLSGLVRDIARLIDRSIPKNVELQLNLAEKLLAVEADASQMEQIVMNLVINAAEAIGQGNRGQVRVSTSMLDLSAADLRRNYPSEKINPGTFVVLEIADDGSGMDDKTRERLFDPFFTTKVTGRGLGLAAVEGIVHGHHGGIRVSSTLGKGTLFQIVLPAVPAAAATATPAPAVQDLHGTGLVLVVDDEPIVLQLTQTILELYGYRVLTAGNGESGVQAVRDNMKELALVILDSTMPVMGGEAALGHIKTAAPKVPVILVSGYDAPHAISHAGEHKLAGFIRKPYMLSNLLETVKSVLSAS